MSRWPSSTAQAWSPSNAIVAAPRSNSSTSPGRSALQVITAIKFKAASVACPIGICHWLNSAQSPRMVTIINSGKREQFWRASVLIQLPTPLDCNNKAPRWPPSQAPDKYPIPSSSVVRTTEVTSLSASNKSSARHQAHRLDVWYQSLSGRRKPGFSSQSGWCREAHDEA